MTKKVESKVKVKVYYKDTDAEGVVYYANYLGWLEMGRTELVESLGLSQSKLREEKGVVFAIREVNCKYLTPAKLGDELEIVTSISKLTGATVIFKQEVIRPSDDKKIIDAEVVAFALDLKKMAPVKLTFLPLS